MRLAAVAFLQARLRNTSDQRGLRVYMECVLYLLTYMYKQSGGKYDRHESCSEMM